MITKCNNCKIPYNRDDLMKQKVFHLMERGFQFSMDIDSMQINQCPGCKVRAFMTIADTVARMRFYINTHLEKDENMNGMVRKLEKALAMR